MISVATVIVDPPLLQPPVRCTRATPWWTVSRLKPVAPDVTNRSPLAMLRLGRPGEQPLNAPDTVAVRITGRVTGCVTTGRIRCGSRRRSR